MTPSNPPAGNRRGRSSFHWPQASAAALVFSRMQCSSSPFVQLDSISFSIYPSESLPDTSCYSSTLLSPVTICSHGRAPWCKTFAVISGLANTRLSSASLQPHTQHVLGNALSFSHGNQSPACFHPRSSESLRVYRSTPPPFHCHAHCGGEPEMNLNGIRHPSPEKREQNYVQFF
jgi:hypothetical protein